MTAADGERVAALCGQLGYPSTPAEVAARFEALAARPANAVFVAEDDESRASSGAGTLPAILGWVYVHEELMLECGPFADLGGLVVHDAARGRGVGRVLVEAAERWAVAHGYAEMRVRSNVVRKGAHAFYRHLGYEIVKTQLNFRKPLSCREGQ
jgi:GNAT superfamily N-acetyltransferase